MFYGYKIAVVIPAFLVEKWIYKVISGIPDYIDLIIVVEDKSPDQTAEVVMELQHPKIKLIRHEFNKGVGGAMKTGFQEAIKADVDIVIKMDGDNQMDPKYLPTLLYPLVCGECDYVKGNRFSIMKTNTEMPYIRGLGNKILAFMTKIASGYWHIFDPQNGYFAIRIDTLRKLRLDWIDDSYFFENSMLINLNIVEARVSDANIPAKYDGEKSSMSIFQVIRSFPFKLIKGFLVRIFYRYGYLDISPVFIMLLVGSIFFLGGTGWGVYVWFKSFIGGKLVTLGSMTIGLIPILLGFQLILNAFVMDIQQSPKGVKKSYDFSYNELCEIIDCQKRDLKIKNLFQGYRGN